jgi:penicillin-binding protein 2
VTAVFKRRLALVVGAFGVYFLLLLARAFQLQIVEARKWRIAAERLSQRQIRLPARRGAILDRHGEVLAADRLELDLVIRPSAVAAHPWRCGGCGRPQVRRSPRTPRSCPGCGGREFFEGEARDWSDLPALLDVSREEFEKRTEEAYAEVAGKVDAEFKLRRRGNPRARRSDVAGELSRWRYLLYRNVPPEVVREVTLRPERSRGLTIRPAYRRVRPAGDSVEILVGRLSGVYEEEFPSYAQRGLTKAEIYRLEVGRSGIERAFEERLAAGEGRRTVDRDVDGRVTRILDEVPARDGETLTLSLDLRLQRAVTEALAEACRRTRAEGGAFVALEPATGEVLALATWPKEPDGGVHLALASAVPGSVYKVATALAGLLSEELDPDRPFDCRNDYHGIGCHGIVHGPIGIEEALAHSCNGYFANAAEEMGVDLLAYWSRELGFGARTGIGLVEDSGLVPDDAWKAARHRKNPRRFRYGVMHAGEVRQVGFGQGYLTVTPLQVACLMAIVANGGHRVDPTLVRGEGRRGPRIVTDERADDLEAAIRRVRRGMEEVVRVGTARTTRLGVFRAAGKTGTAEIADSELNMAWFAGYAPAEAPRVAFACYLRRTAEGGADAAGPVVARFLEEYARE